MENQKSTEKIKTNNKFLKKLAISFMVLGVAATISILAIGSSAKAEAEKVSDDVKNKIEEAMLDAGYIERISDIQDIKMVDANNVAIEVDHKPENEIGDSRWSYGVQAMKNKFTWFFDNNFNYNIPSEKLTEIDD